MALTLLASFPAAGLEEVWRYDMGCGLPHLPVVMSYEGESGRCVYVASRLSNTIEVLSAQGREVATFTRPRRIAGGIACNSVLDQLLFEEGDGCFVLFNRQRPENFLAEGNTLAGAGGVAQLAFADLDGDNLPEVLIASGEGTLCVYDRKMAPQWQYDAGQPLSGGIAGGPVFENWGGVYMVCRDGSVHAVGGTGEPLWRRALPPRGFTTGNHRRVLVLQRAGRPSLVIVTDATGSVYAMGADDGEVKWEARVGGTDAGTPAVVEGRLIVLCEDGACGTLNESGEMVLRGALPSGLYVPRPLAADVDGDGREELVAATMDRRVVVASLDGDVKETLSLPGNASQGLILSDIDEDGVLELITVTDCGRVICHKTRARSGWTHPAGNPAMNGYVPKRGPANSRAALPAQKRARRSARVESVTIRDFVKESPFGAAFVRARVNRKTETATAVIRCNGKVVGSTCKRIDRDGFYVPFVQTSSEPLTLDLSLYNSEGRVVASSSDITIASGPVRLVNLTPIDEFLQAVGSRADAFVTPSSWDVPAALEWMGGNGNLVSMPAGTWTYCEAGGSSLYAPMQFAFLRGLSRQRGGSPWGVSILPGPVGVVAGQAPPGPEWVQRIGPPPQLGLRLEVAAYFSGATFIASQPREAVEAERALAGGRGTPYTPVAFMLDSRNGWRADAELDGVWPKGRGERAVDAMLRHAYASREMEDLQFGHLTSGPYGDIFDIIVRGAGSAGFEPYGVVWPLGDLEVEKTEAKDLIKYVEGGGILVVDAALALRLRSYVPGIQFTGRTAIGTQVQTALAATGPVSAPYRYHVMEAGAKRVLAWTDAGDPLLVWRPMGYGLLILGATDHWTDETDQLLPVAEALLKTLTEAFVPIQIPSNFEVILNRVADGWIVGALNNSPVFKSAGDSAPAFSADSAECIMRLKKGSLLRFTPQMGQFKWNNAAGGLSTTLPPGEAAVVRVTLHE